MSEKYRRLDVGGLTSAPARLLLVLFQEPGQPEHIVMERSGITETATYVAARKVLESRGFIRKIEGQEYFSLWEQEPESEFEPERKPLATIPYIGMIRTTNAKQ